MARKASPKRRKPLKNLRILITNDDGINGPGLKVAEKIARALSDDVWVIAPETDQSGASHSLTLKHPLRVRHVSRRRYALEGTPTDCVMLGVNHLLEEGPPDLLLSGVNRGANMGEDVIYSGTVAAATEGAVLGIPSIAMSQSTTRGSASLHWGTAEKHAPDLIHKLMKAGWSKGVCLNINFPNVVAGSVKGTVITYQGTRDVTALEILEREHPRGGNYYWLAPRRRIDRGGRASDLQTVYWDNKISVTPLNIDRTARGVRTALSKALDG